MLLKEYAASTVAVPTQHRYSPAHIISTTKIKIAGNPDLDKVSTSLVDRSNLSVRLSQRRFTRLTNAFSKKFRNHAAAVALFVCFYNLCRVHMTLRVTQAMALGITDHIWSLEELLAATLSTTAEPSNPPPAESSPAPRGGNRGQAPMAAAAFALRPMPSPEPIGRAVPGVPWLRVIEGGATV
jgi:hypothetical protein